jgi:hypothetical protein
MQTTEIIKKKLCQLEIYSYLRTAGSILCWQNNIFLYHIFIKTMKHLHLSTFLAEEWAPPGATQM